MRNERRNISRHSSNSFAFSSEVNIVDSVLEMTRNEISSSSYLCILNKFQIYAERVLQKLFLVKFCYLTEASTAETAINSDQEVEKNDPRKP